MKNLVAIGSKKPVNIISEKIFYFFQNLEVETSGYML